MNWLKKQKCIVSRKNAQVAHHIRLGTNGGQGIKPSDYFCVPLLNIYHTGGIDAVHNIGEETFFKKFKLSKEKVFSHYLQQYLLSAYKIELHRKEKGEEEEDESLLSFIYRLVNKIEENRSEKEKESEKQKKIKLPSITKNEFYQKAKEAKKIKDKALRQKIKEEAPETINLKPKKASETEFYQKAKEAKRASDKALRQKIKEESKTAKPKPVKKTASSSLNIKPKKASKPSKSSSNLSKENPAYQKAKELKKAYEQELREKLKAKQSEYRKAQYQRLKELKK